nr:unnamed protein product [Digitaria exilis]
MEPGSRGRRREAASGKGAADMDVVVVRDLGTLEKPPEAVEVCGGRVPLVELVAIVPVVVEDIGEGRP